MRLVTDTVARSRLAILYESAETGKKWGSTVEWYVNKIRDNRERYEVVAMEVGMPWQAIACIHALEGGLKFDTVLHNGESLKSVNKRGTRLVPKGRGKRKNWTWEMAAIDALEMKRGIMPYKWTKKEYYIDEILDFLERYNGIGYRRYHPEIDTPYLWSGTQHYTKGKYVSDGKYSATAVSKQIGCVPLLKVIGFR